MCIPCTITLNATPGVFRQWDREARICYEERKAINREPDNLSSYMFECIASRKKNSKQKLIKEIVMKKLLCFLFMLGLVFCATSPLIAGGIDNKHNLSTEYIRTLNRNAATDSADAVVYNPAGVVKMQDGLYVNLSGQYALKNYSNTVAGTEYDTDNPDLVPSLFGLYRKDRWAVYAAFTIPCGGGTVDYEKGDATTWGLGQQVIASSGGLFSFIQDQSLEAKSYYYGFTVGGAYAFNNMISLSLGVRYINAQREFEGSATLSGLATRKFSVSYEETGNGWGGIVGINISPTKDFNIGLRYETKTSLELKTEEKTDDISMITDGATRKRDLPALLGIGVAYTITPNLKAEANLTCYLNKNADWDDNPITGADETKRNNGYDVGIALEYAFTQKVKGSLGYMYTYVGIDPDDMSIENPELDANSIAAGIAYEPVPKLSLNFGVLRTFYEGETTSGGIEFNKKVSIIAFGIQYKWGH